MWDLSAAFDCLDINILCDKLKIYGFEANTVKWFIIPYCSATAIHEMDHSTSWIAARGLRQLQI